MKLPQTCLADWRQMKEEWSSLVMTDRREVRAGYYYAPPMMPDACPQDTTRQVFAALGVELGLREESA